MRLFPPWRHALRQILFRGVILGAITAAVGYGVKLLIDRYVSIAVQKKVEELSIPVRSVQQSRIFETRGGPVRTDFTDPRYDEIKIPSRDFQDHPSLEVPTGKAAILVVSANANTAFDLPRTAQPQGIGFRLDILVNEKPCATNATQSTLVGNRPEISAVCIVSLKGGTSNTIQINRGVNGSGFINNPDITFMRAYYTLLIFDENPR